ncbi:ABC transporter ATP-binding protein [Arcanobacterium hippocoleae]|uniref:ABC transport system ATP-binding protein n=1 Tax=Arcanobacterium hippocoleae TaxID=149017 RepID=A0ABU1T0K2_9ACTO|nr:ABC transporter ATP-binding protein [Arcanobacterium hippocoleae]MDR6938825.1 putative ABC transport system ATP-binding protein [Arcanobacterium hippocoleae]
MQIQISNLTKAFADRDLFRELNHSFVPNQVNVILGESGSGKTTLLNIIGLFESADAGQILYDGVIVSGRSNRETRKIIRATTGYIYQDIRLFEDLSVRENIEIALRFSHVPKSDWRSRTDVLLERMGLGGFANKPANQLSGGEKQRIAIARTVASDKKLILADEPTGALDEDNSKIIVNLLQDIATNNGCTVILVTHSHLVADTFKHQHWLQGGRLLDSGEHSEG